MEGMSFNPPVGTLNSIKNGLVMEKIKTSICLFYFFMTL